MCDRELNEREATELCACDACHALTHGNAPSLNMRWPCGCHPRGFCEHHAKIGMMFTAVARSSRAVTIE
jgi:hypothetical protein